MTLKRDTLFARLRLLFDFTQMTGLLVAIGGTHEPAWFVVRVTAESVLSAFATAITFYSVQLCVTLLPAERYLGAVGSDDRRWLRHQHVGTILVLAPKQRICTYLDPVHVVPSCIPDGSCDGDADAEDVNLLLERCCIASLA